MAIAIDAPESLHPDYDDLERYLSFLAGMTNEKEIFTYCLMDAESIGPMPGCGVMHGKAKDIYSDLITYSHTVTLHICLNRTNLKGRRRENISGVRVLCADLDGETTTTNQIKEIVAKYSPGLIVESSPSRYHIYWKLSPEIPLDVWSTLQLGLAKMLGGDYSLNQVTHTIRAPGILRVKDGKIILPRTVYLQPDSPELGIAEVQELFPGIEESAGQAQKEIESYNRRIRSRVKKSFNGGEVKQLREGDVKFGRNKYLYEYLKEWGKTGELEKIKEEAERVNRRFELPLEEKETDLIIKKVLPKIEWAKEQGEKREEERKDSREKLLNQLVIESPIAPNGVHVNGAIHDNAGEFAYDYSRPRLKNCRISDSGLVERIIQRFGHSLIRCGKITYAFQETTQLWTPQSQSLGTQVVRSMVLKCADDLCADPVLVEMCSDKDGVDPAKVLKEQQKWHSHRSINGAVVGVLNEEQIRSDSSSIFDATPQLFYAANGVVDMGTWEIRKATPQDYMLKRSPVVFDREATCDWWLEFLQEVLASNPNKHEELEYLQELFGYALTGSVDEQKIFIHTGEGSNGKSRVISALSALCGDYAARLSSSTLSKSKNAVLREIERIGAKIEGKRAVIIDDLDSRTQWNDGFLKALTDDYVIARNLYHEERDIPNRAKIHICCNDIPEPEKGNEALYRRLAILDYNRKFEVNPQKAKEIKIKIKENLSGILNWAIEGYQRMARNGNRINYPKSVEYRLQAYRDATADSGGTYEELSKLFSRELAQTMAQMDPEDLANEQHWHLLEDLASSIGASKDAVGRVLTQNGFLKARKRKHGKGRPHCYFVQID